MILNVTAAFSDGWDGSYTIKIFNEKQEALEWLDRTEEEVKNGNPYEDGAILELEIEVDENGKLSKPVIFSIG